MAPKTCRQQQASRLAVSAHTHTCSGPFREVGPEKLGSDAHGSGRTCGRLLCTGSRGVGGDGFTGAAGGRRVLRGSEAWKSSLSPGLTGSERLISHVDLPIWAHSWGPLRERRGLRWEEGQPRLLTVGEAPAPSHPNTAEGCPGGVARGSHQITPEAVWPLLLCARWGPWACAPHRWGP